MKSHPLALPRLLFLAATALPGASLATSCASKGEDRGGLMLEITTDGSVVDRVDVEVTTGGKKLLGNSYRVPSEAVLPTTVAIVSSGNAETVVNIAVIGWRAGTPIDRRDAIVTQVPTDRVAALLVVLSARCSGHVSLEGDTVVSDCASGQTCDPLSADAGCTDSTVAAPTLMSYAPGAENVEAGVPMGVAGGGSGGGGGSSGADSLGGAGDAGQAGVSAGAAGAADTGGGGSTSNPECRSKADCVAKLPKTTPAGCAEATCDSSKKCVFLAADADMDGHRAKICVPASNVVSIETGDDCDDADPGVFPGAWDGPATPAIGGSGAEPDHCDNIDQDCDGTADNGKVTSAGATKSCACDPAKPRLCYEYPNGVPIAPATLDVGICHRGMQTCTNGVPGGCMGAVGPATETCNGVDDDCDGVKDNNAVGAVAQCQDRDNDSYCTTNCMVACSPPVGYRSQATCLAGVDCNDTAATVHPAAAELCGDGVDSNCVGGDNEPFTNLGAACINGTYGVCRRKGSYVCSADKQSTTCSAAVVTAQGAMTSAATAADIDTSTTRAGYNPLWDWNCDNVVTQNVKVQEGAFRASACSGDYAGACGIYTQAECGQGGFLGATYFNCDSSGGFFLSGQQICGHNISYVGCLWDWNNDGKCDYLANTVTANGLLSCE